MSSTAVRRCYGERLARGIYYYERRNLIANRNWIAVSRHILALTESVFGVSPGRFAVIYNAVLPARSLQPKALELPSRFVLSAGEVRAFKGVLVLAEAALEFLKERPDVHLVFVGSIYKENGRPVSKDILDIVGPELSERVHFLGHVDRETLLECMTRASVFAFPSRLEAFPFVPLEAMSCGLPVVCTNYPPGPELVEDGVTGLLADPLSPNDFSNKIICLLDNPELANRLAANARRVVAERFSFERCMDETERFYEDCLRH
jgi:glycosyltransferase involved in cell wall biosynthesis